MLRTGPGAELAVQQEAAWEQCSDQEQRGLGLSIERSQGQTTVSPMGALCEGGLGSQMEFSGETGNCSVFKYCPKYIFKTLRQDSAYEPCQLERGERQG